MMVQRMSALNVSHILQEIEIPINMSHICVFVQTNVKITIFGTLNSNIICDKNVKTLFDSNQTLYNLL